MKKSIYLLVIFLMLSCQHKKKEPVFSEDVFNIESSVFLDESFLQDPRNLLLFDSLLVVANYKGEPLIEVYDTKGNRLCNFLNIGNGPEEMLVVGNLQKSLSNNTILVFDLFRKHFFEFDPNNMIQSDFKIDSVYSYSNLLYLDQKDSTTVLFDKLLRGKNCIIGGSRDPRGRVVLLDFDGHLVNFGGSFPPNEGKDKGLSDYGNTVLYASDFVLNDDGSMLAMATYNADMIDIFDISDIQSVPKSVWSYKDFLPHDFFVFDNGGVMMGGFTDESRKGYHDLTASQKYVYALFSGRKQKGKDYYYGNIIRVANWNGTKRFELHTDVDIKRITVSSDDKKIYAISKDEEDGPVIVSFDIEKIIEITD